MPPPNLKKNAAWLKFLEQALYLSYCPTFIKLAWIVHLDLRIDLKELDAESELQILDDGGLSFRSRCPYMDIGK